jgi:ankyrin repeat protein
MKANIFSASKHKTPLQYACSLGLYLIVARLLKEGANPDLLPQGKDRS